MKPITTRTALALLLATAAASAHTQSLDTRFEYDALGRPTATIDAAGNAERNTWDALGRLKSEVNPLDERTTYGYAGTDIPTRVEAPHGAVTIFDVDGLGQVHSETSPDRGTTTYIHDAAGNLTSRIDARGARMDTAYDALNRPTERRFLRPDGSLETTHTYTWDSAPHGIGRLAALATGTNTLEFAYTPAGEVAARTYTRGGVLLAALWDYHPATGQLQSLTYPSGSVIAYAYDAAGSPVHLEWDGVPIATEIEYFPFGPPTAILLANGVDHLREYDTAGRLAAFTLAGETVEIGYDAAGRIVALSPTTGTRAQQFGYDAAGRLTDYQHLTDTEAYTYDPNGNRTSRSANGLATVYGYTPFSNRLTDVGNVHLTYDLAGNLTADTRVLAYDSTGRLVELSAAGPITRYEYNGLGERSYKGQGAAGTHYLYDEAGHLIGEYDGNGRPVMEYAWLGDLPVAVRRYRYPDGVQQVELFAVEADHLGTPRVVTDATQQVRWRWHSRPFGDTEPDENPAGLGPFAFNLRFPGQYFDAESGLHYNYFRGYDPQTGRYVESDPIGLDGAINTYAYVDGDPLMYIDPNGLWALGGPLPQGVVDFGAGMGDVILFGQGQRLRDLLDVSGGIDRCSSEYNTGEWAGIGVSVATGVAGGIRVAGARGAGKEFSHWIPNRLGGPRSVWNGNYVSTSTHALSDPYRYRFMPRSWKAENPLPHGAWQQWVRIPLVYKGGAVGGAYGVAGSGLTGDCTCPQ